MNRLQCPVCQGENDKFTATTSESGELVLTCCSCASKISVTIEETEGEKLATLRKETGMTQTELAKALGVSVDTIQSIESGRRNGSKKFWGGVSYYVQQL